MTLILDGSLGDGGGQILRTALALSLATGKAFRIEKIRAKREKLGVLRQHLAAVRAAAAVCGAEVDPAADIGAAELTFRPGEVRPGEYRFAVGAAGSVVLLLQTILPGLMLAAGPSVVTLEGGTHVPDAPPPEFLEKALVPVLARMGPRVSVSVERAGFYPAAGGRVVAHVEPVRSLTPVDLTERGEARHRLCRAVVAGLPGEIALRELELVRRMMDWPEECFQIRQLPDDEGPGNAVIIEVGSEHVTEVFSACGARGTRAEAVAESVLQQAKAYLADGAPVGKHLATQLLVPMALSRGGSFVTDALPGYLAPQAEVIGAFLDGSITTTEVGRNRCRVEVAAGRGMP